MLIFDLDARQNKVRLSTELDLDQYRFGDNPNDATPGIYVLAMLVLRYDLRATSQSAVEGHYALATKHPLHDVWLLIDDLDVSAYQLPDGYAENVHLAIYFRRDWASRIVESE